MAKKYLDDAGVLYFWGKLKDYFQQKLVSGTNIKTVNGSSLLGSGDVEVVEESYSTSTSNATAGSNISIGVLEIATYGKVVSMFMRITPSAAISSSAVVATLNSAFKPKVETFIQSGAEEIDFWITPEGQIKTRAALTKNANYYIHGVYVMA